jgi:hypothetical protein
MPELIETIQEHALIDGENRAEAAAEVTTPSAGYCDHCGSWSDNLIQVNGEFLCEDCKVEIESETEE